MAKLIVVFGDQLFLGLPEMPSDATVFMREDFGFAQRSHYHKQKLVFVFSAMRHFAASLPNVQYERLDPQDLRSYRDAVVDCIRRHGITELFAYEPANSFVLQEVLTDLPCTLTLVKNPMFLTSREEWEQYRSSHRRLLMQDFYIQRRKALKILVDENLNPVGGKWSFDHENRKRLPNNVLPPVVLGSEPDSLTKEVVSEVERYFPNHPGKTTFFAYPVTHAEAKNALGEFIQERLSLFGDYEDALPQGERTVFHSVLSPLINFGLLTPRQVIHAVLQADVPMNSKEGFIRQVLGWREFIFHMSRTYDVSSLPNALNNDRRLKPCWYDGTTGLSPLDVAIRRVDQYAWCHHIERLMVIGSVMLMSEVSPSESYRWFMELFIDSADWVMLPNVVGMSQFADGGLFATKPYISGSNYILKMSDYRRGDWCDVWDGLYWRFLHHKRSHFESNHRMMPMLRLLDKMERTKLQRHVSIAEKFIDQVTEL